MNELLGNCARTLLQTHKKAMEKELKSGKIESLELLYNARPDGMWDVVANFSLKGRKTESFSSDEDEALAEIIELGIGMFGSKKMIFENNISEIGGTMENYDGINCFVKS